MWPSDALPAHSAEMQDGEMEENAQKTNCVADANGLSRVGSVREAAKPRWVFVKLLLCNGSATFFPFVTQLDGERWMNKGGRGWSWCDCLPV